VLGILGEQNEVLGKLAEDSDEVLEPLARERDSVAGFIENANTTARATASRRAALEATFARLPRFLDELRPTMERLGGLSGEMAPVLEDLGSQAPAINQMVGELGPFSKAAIPALRTLGEATEVGGPALQRSKPLIEDLRGLAREGRPTFDDLSDLLVSLRDTGGIERLMDFLFFQTSAINGFDEFGHYLRASLLVNNCAQYANEPGPGCSAALGQEETGQARASANDPEAVKANFARAAKARRRAPAQQPAPQPQRQPRQQPAAAQRRQPTAAPDTAAQEGLLDYLLGDGS
jgi:ABC-type transporter Mla subunit MlaD